MSKRITFSVILGIFAILISLGIISYLSVHDSIQQSLKNRLTMANIVGKYFDYLLEANISRLYDISISGKIDFEDNDWEPEKKALKAAYEYSIFTDRIFLLDLNGNIIIKYPHQEEWRINLMSIPYVSRTINEKRPVISDVYTIEPTKKKVIFVFVPLRNKNDKIIGIAGGEINPTNYMFMQIIRSFPADTNTNIELIDSHGTIIASNDQKRVLTCSDHNKFLGNLIATKKSSVGTCHRCHLDEAENKRTNDMLAFAPLSVAPWGVSIRDPQEIVFSPATKLKKGFLVLSFISVLSALVLSVGLSKSIVRPVKSLINATEKIAQGNLSDPITVPSRDEIGFLARSIDKMRIKLAESLDNIQRHNIELEHRVAARTQQIRQSRQKVQSLLKQVISSQEVERNRIARGLHDDILQDLSAFLIKLEICRIYPDQISIQQIDEMRNIMLKTIDNIYNVIQDMRPSILDDLGLGDSIKWLTDRHLGEKGIHCYHTIEAEMNERFNPLLEITSFRIIQEAIINIERHAKAKNVFILLNVKADSVIVEIEDDGNGFDAHSISPNTLGLLGMKERASLVDGKLEICSTPGNGTRISLRILFGKPSEKNV